MKIQIISVGEPKKHYFKEAIEEYSKRLDGFSVARLVVKDNKDSYAKIEQLTRGTYTVALDEHGKQFASRQLAKYLEEIELQGTTTMSLVVGPADGHSDEYLQGCDYVLSLSKLTMPHEMALLFACEAVYRALSIRNNHPYHRD